MIRLLKAFGFSCQGLWAALKEETAFKQEVIMLVILLFGACWLTGDYLERCLLVGSWILVMVVELLNSALEGICDEVTLDKREGIKKVKDYGSAAVLLSIILSLMIWSIVLWPVLKEFLGA